MERRTFFARCFGGLAPAIVPWVVKVEPKWVSTMDATPRHCVSIEEAQRRAYIAGQYPMVRIAPRKPLTEEQRTRMIDAIRRKYLSGVSRGQRLCLGDKTKEACYPVA